MPLNHRPIRSLSFLTLLAAVCMVASAAAQDETPSKPKWGHSHRGKAWDAGPRSRPWKMAGIGRVKFPVTSSHPEVRAWFEQGVALLHSFWNFEAERSFRWCTKLDPECAMAYWGLSLATEDDERSAAFLAEAVKRKDKVTARERAYIDVAEARGRWKKAKKADKKKTGAEAMVVLDRLVMDHPDDLEAKAFYWLMTGELAGRRLDDPLCRYGLEAVLDDILEADPDHVGALHFRVHNWDGKEGRYAIDSCLHLQKIAPRSGHLQHMPGHVLSGIGLWHEAAIAMDSATRVEKAYMHERMVLPEDNWDYVHNLDYLSYIQSQLGLYEAARTSAEQLLLAPTPTDPKGPTFLYQQPLRRLLVKYERWDELLGSAPSEILADGPPPAKLGVLHARCRALIGKGRLDEARSELEKLRTVLELPEGAKPDDMPFLGLMKGTLAAFVNEIEGLIALASNEPLRGIELLSRAAEKQVEHWYNDPPMAPSFAYNLLGEAYLDLGAARLAAKAFERTLENVFEDGFALSGLVRAHHALGEDDRAREYLARLKWIWIDADPNRWLDAALATELEAEPRRNPLHEERRYVSEVLAKQGPSLYTPPPASTLAALDASGLEIGLDAFAGKNVVLVFYLGDECLHCMEQITGLNERLDALAAEDTVVVAVSKDPVEKIAEYEKEGKIRVKLLSDPGFENARRFNSYDDFEDIELHSTFLIDKERRVHWARNGGAPFANFDWLMNEVKRVNSGVVSDLLGERIAAKPGKEESPDGAGD